MLSLYQCWSLTNNWLLKDAEHVAWSPALLVECIQIIIHESAGKMIPVVRVPSKTAFDYMVKIDQSPILWIRLHEIPGLVPGCGRWRHYCATFGDGERDGGGRRCLPLPVRVDFTRIFSTHSPRSPVRSAIDRSHRLHSYDLPRFEYVSPE